MAEIMTDFDHLWKLVFEVIDFWDAATHLGRRQRLFRATADRLALGLRHQRHDADGQVIGLREVAGHKPHPAGLQGQQKGRVA